MSPKHHAAPIAARPDASPIASACLLAAALLAASLLAAGPVWAEPLASLSENGRTVEFTRLVLDPKAKTWTGVAADGQTKRYNSDTAKFETAAGILKCEWNGLSFYADSRELPKDHVSLRWENENWNLNGGDQTTPAGVVSWKNARRRPVDVGIMVYMPQMEGMWRFETAPPVEDRFFQGAYDCDVITGAGIFVPDGSKMILYWPASDEKRGGRTPIAVSMDGGAYVLEHGSVPAKALPPAWTHTSKAKGTTDASGSAAVSPQD